MQVVTLRLHDDEWERLLVLARMERRQPREQAAFLVAAGLRSAIVEAEVVEALDRPMIAGALEGAH